MPLALLDGTDAAVDLMVTFPSGSSGSSLRCITTDIDYNETRQFQRATTLCSGKWVQELPGELQAFLTVGKLDSKGSIISDLSPLMTATAAANVTLTLGSGCTKTGTFWMDNDRHRVNAGQFAMPGSTSLRSYGAVATAWVIT